MLSAESDPSGGPQHFALSTQHLALFVSFLLHPFLLVPATLMVLAGRTPGVYLAAGIIAIVFAVIVLQVRRQRWSNHDVSDRQERRGLYWVAITLTAVSAAALHYSNGTPAMVRGFLAATAMLAAAMLVNRVLKVSMHLMFAAFCAVLVASSHPRTMTALIAALALLAWSRLHLKRHTWLEVVAGTAIGALTAFVLTQIS